MPTTRTPRKAPATKKATPPRKAPAKKAAAVKKPGTRPKGKVAGTRTPGKPGPTPRILEGFDRKARTWGETSTVGTLLLVLSWGATWEHAASRARIHPAQPRRWITRGQTLLTPDAETVVDLDDLDAQGIPDEEFAAALFVIESTAHRAAPVLGALETITREAGKDWRAAGHALRVLPEARPYRETTRQEVTGEDGGPVAHEVTADLTRTVLDLAGRIADETAGGADA